MEKVWRKKLDDREKVLQERIGECDKEISEMRVRHEEDIKLERDRTENRLRENLKSQLRTELSQEMQLEFDSELAKTHELHKQELEEIKRQHDTLLRKETAKFEEMLKSPKSSNLPKQVEEVEV